MDGIAALVSLAQAGATSFSRATSKLNAATGRPYFDDLRVWVDADHDARTDAGELKTLAELGIASIGLVRIGNKGETIAGNDVLNRATFTRTNGTKGQMASVDFQVEGAAITTSTLTGAMVQQVGTTNTAFSSSTATAIASSAARRNGSGRMSSATAFRRPRARRALERSAPRRGRGRRIAYVAGSSDINGSRSYFLKIFCGLEPRRASL